MRLLRCCVYKGVLRTASAFPTCSPSLSTVVPEAWFLRHHYGICRFLTAWHGISLHGTIDYGADPIPCPLLLKGKHACFLLNFHAASFRLPPRTRKSIKQQLKAMLSSRSSHGKSAAVPGAPGIIGPLLIFIALIAGIELAILATKVTGVYNCESTIRLFVRCLVLRRFLSRHPSSPHLHCAHRWH